MSQSSQQNVKARRASIGNFSNRIFHENRLDTSSSDVVSKTCATDYYQRATEQSFQSSRHLEIFALGKVRICVVGDNIAADRQWLACGAESSIEFLFCETQQEARRLVHAMRIDAWVIRADTATCWCMELCSEIRSIRKDAVICLVAGNCAVQSERLCWQSGVNLVISQPMLPLWLDSWVPTVPMRSESQYVDQQQLPSAVAARMRSLPTNNSSSIDKSFHKHRTYFD